MHVVTWYIKWPWSSDSTSKSVNELLVRSNGYRQWGRAFHKAFFLTICHYGDTLFNSILDKSSKQVKLPSGQRRWHTDSHSGDGKYWQHTFCELLQYLTNTANILNHQRQWQYSGVQTLLTALYCTYTAQTNMKSKILFWLETLWLKVIKAYTIYAKLCICI